MLLQSPLCVRVLNPQTRLPKQFSLLQGQLYSQRNKLCRSPLKIHEVKCKRHSIRTGSITYVYKEFSFQIYVDLCTLNTEETPSVVKVTRMYTHTLTTYLKTFTLETIHVLSRDVLHTITKQQPRAWLIVMNSVKF
jgi:hypothetical protein